MIDGIPNRPLYFYQKDMIGELWRKHGETLGENMVKHWDSTKFNL